MFVTKAMTSLSRMSTGCSTTSPPSIPGEGLTKTPTHHRLPRPHVARSAGPSGSSGAQVGVRLPKQQAHGLVTGFTLGQCADASLEPLTKPITSAVTVLPHDDQRLRQFP